MKLRTFYLWVAWLITKVDGDSLDFGRNIAVSLTRGLVDSTRVIPVAQSVNMPQSARGAYTGVASHSDDLGVVLQTCVANTAADCSQGRGQASPLIFTMPGAATNLPAGTFVVTAYVLLLPAFGLPAVGIQSSYSIDLRLMSQGTRGLTDVEPRSLRPIPMIVQMPLKSGDCPTSHVAIGLKGECGVKCMMYDSRLATWSPIGVTTGAMGNGVVNCSLSTLPAHILVSQFLSEIRVAMVADRSVNVIQNFFNGSLIDELVRWTGASAANFRVEAFRPFSASRLDMTRIFLVLSSASIDPESMFQAIKRLPGGGKIPADAGTGWTQEPLNILMVEKYYTQVPLVATDSDGGVKCFEQADCSPGLYCDEFSKCYSCGPGSISPGYCDSITYDCCSPAFRQQCTNNPYNCSDLSPTPATITPLPLAPSLPRVSRYTNSPSTASPFPPSPSASVLPPSPLSLPLSPLSTSVIQRPAKNGRLFRIISLQPQFFGVNDSLFAVADRAFSTVDPQSAVTAVSLSTQGATLTTIGEIIPNNKTALTVYDSLVQQGSSPSSTLRSQPLFSRITSIRMFCGYGLWRPRCSRDTLEDSLNATLLLSPSNSSVNNNAIFLSPATTNAVITSAQIVANLEAASGVTDRFVVTEIQQRPLISNSSNTNVSDVFANFSIVPPEQGEVSSQSIYDLLSLRLPQRKTIIVFMNFSSLDPAELVDVQNALCALANSALGITLTREDLCNNITLTNSTQQQWVFVGPITRPLTPAMIIRDINSFTALEDANNGTALNEGDIRVVILDSPLVPQAQVCVPPFVRTENGACNDTRGAFIAPAADEGLSLLAKVLIGVFVGLALCLLLCLLLCCWKRLFCFKKKEKKIEKDEPVTNITFIDQTPLKKTEPRTESNINIINNDSLNNNNNSTNTNARKIPHPDISPLHKSSFSHQPISLNEQEGTSRNGFEYDSHSSDDEGGGFDTEKRSFHFRLETKPAVPDITPMKLHSPSSNTSERGGRGGMSPSETVMEGPSPYPPFMSLQTPATQRRVPPQPRLQPVFPSPMPTQQTLLRPHARKESLDAKHGSEPPSVQRTMSNATPKNSLQPSQRQTTQSAQRLQSTPYQGPRQNTPSQARFPQTPQDNNTRRVEQTPTSAMAFSAPPTDTDDGDETEDGSNTTQEGEYSDENRTRYGHSRSRGGTPVDERRGLVGRNS